MSSETTTIPQSYTADGTTIQLSGNQFSAIPLGIKGVLSRTPTYSTNNPTAYTPTSATHRQLIIATCDVKDTDVSSANYGNATLVDSVSGTLATQSWYVGATGSTDERATLTLVYAGTLTAAAHNISIAHNEGGANAVLSNIKITIMEFVAPA